MFGFDTDICVEQLGNTVLNIGFYIGKESKLKIVSKNIPRL